MTSGELAAICGVIVSGLGGIGTVLRWGVLRITNVIEKNSSTMLEFVKSAARLEVKLDQAHAASLSTDKAVQEIAEEVTGTHEIPVEFIDEDELLLKQPPPFVKTKTPPGGYAIVNVKRKGTRT